MPDSSAWQTPKLKTAATKQGPHPGSCFVLLLRRPRLGLLMVALVTALALLAYAMATRPEQPAPAAPQSPFGSDIPARDLPKPVVLIDPGHGGGDGGAVWASVVEKDINLAVALRLKEALEKTGLLRVVMTRDIDVHIPMSGRIEIAAATKPSLILSIHANSFDLAYVRGVETYYRPDAPQSREAASLLHAAVLRSYRDTNHTTMDREIRPGSFRILTQSHASRAVLLELGYLSNQEDRRILNDPTFQAALAENLAQSIISMLTQRP